MSIWLVVKPSLRLAAAIEMFKAEEVSLSRAAEIAGITRWQLQDILAERGIPPVVEVESVEDLEWQVETIRRLRRGAGRQQHPRNARARRATAPSVAVCQARGYAFLTNDKRTRNFYRTEGIEALDLAGVLRALWETGVLSKNKVKSLITDIETKEKLVIKDKSAIFAKR